MEKKTKGRQKIEMKKIEDADALQVTFSKRRSGLFKKASELSTLCGAELAIVVHSPAGRPFTFGQPGVDVVANRFLGSSSGSGSGPRANPYPIPDPMELYREATVHHLNWRCMEISDQLESQKKKREELVERLRMLSRGPRGALVHGREGLQTLKLEDLEQITKELEDLKVKANARVNEMLNGAAGPSGMPLEVNPIQMVNPYWDKAMNVAPAWFMGPGGPSFK